MIEAAIAGAALPIIGAIIGEIAAEPDDRKADAMRRRAMEQYNIDIPPVQQIRAQAVQSQAAGAQGSTEAKAARLAALRRLSQVGQEGYTAEDRAAMNEALSESAQQERSGREAILRRIPRNSGASIAAQLSNQQAAAQRSNAEGLNIAGDSRRRALQALSQQGQLAGDIDTSEFGQSFGRGQAADAITQFNERNRLDVAKRNADAVQQEFENRYGLAQGRAGMYGSQAEAAERRARARRATWGGIGQGAGQMAGGAGQAYGGK